MVSEVNKAITVDKGIEIQDAGQSESNMTQFYRFQINGAINNILLTEKNCSKNEKNQVTN